MEGYFDGKLDRTNQYQPISATGLAQHEFLQILGLKAKIYFRMLRNRILPIAFSVLCVTVLLWTMQNCTLDHYSTVGTKFLNLVRSASLNVTRVRRTPTLAIVMVLTPDLINSPIARTSVANKQSYAKKHGYEFILDTVIDRTRSAPWARIVSIHSLMHTRPDIEWIWSLDMDAFILEKQIDIYDQVTKKYQWGLDRKRNVTKDILVSEDCPRPDSFNAGCKSTVHSL